jgi:hypothetical protein
MATAVQTIPGLAPRRQGLGRTVISWVTSTDHKTIGYMYLITSFMWFGIGGILALLIRAELFEPGIQIVASKEQYNQLFTMHGTIMLLLFATPLFAGFANVIMPLQIGAPDVAFPRLNMFAYWLYLFGGIIAASGFLTPQGAASFGWFAYAPLSSAVYSRARWRPVGVRAGTGRIRDDPRRRQLHHDCRDDACARHDDVPDARVHVGRADHEPPDPHGVPAPHLGALRARR